MITVKLFSYPNTAEIQIFDSRIFTTRNREVYSRPIKVYQGIDNPLQVVVKNQDQKPVDVTGYLVQVDIQDPLLKGSMESLPVTITNITLGQGTVTIPRDIVNSLDQRLYKLTVKLINQGTNNERPLYTDANFGAAVDLEVLPGWYESMPGTLDSDEVLDAGTI